MLGRRQIVMGAAAAAGSGPPPIRIVGEVVLPSLL
jgi:hypothetical protein